MKEGLKLIKSSLMEIVGRPTKSYSQFGEDAVLQFLLNDRLRENSPGFYVDVGAFAPKLFSNTYWFYRRGWRGINIDATPGSMRTFNLLRRRDINLEIAVCEEPGHARLFKLGVRSVYNTTRESVARTVEKEKGFSKSEPIVVPAEPLHSILGRYCNQDIDFLTVDVEGADIEVLRSNDWSRFRPSIVIVEDTTVLPGMVEGSEISRFLRSHRYVACALVGPSVFYRMIE